MKWKNVLAGIAALLLFFVIILIIPTSKKISGSVNYAPEGYRETIEQSINGVVLTVMQNGLFWVEINKEKLPFSYDPNKLQKDWQQVYPKEFITVGDSIFKKSDNDTFYVIRDKKNWLYILPNN